jgi:pyruvate,water dikinase
MKTDNSLNKELAGAEQEKFAIGEKAYNLGLLIRHGFKVPKFRVVTIDHFKNFVDQNGLAQKIEKLLAQCKTIDPLSINQTQKEIQQILSSQPLPISLNEEIKGICKDLSGPLMVRSSAVGEDSTDASFAGQLDSFQSDGSTESVKTAIRKCWSSYWSARSLSYQHAKGKVLQGMGVMIQELVEPLYAGVVFTQSPNNSMDEMLIEYCYGHGENLVSGNVTPGEITVRKKSQTIKIKPFSPDSGLYNATPSLTEQTSFIHELIRHSLKLEALFACPLDIEWAVNHNNALFLLQARPITTVKQQRKIFWSNVNVNENYPEPISPFLYSIALNSYYFYFKNLAKSLGIKKELLLKAEFQFKNIIGAHGARMYYNMTNIHAVINLLPLGNTFSAFFNNFVGADENDKGVADRNHQQPHNFIDKLRFAGNTLASLILAPLKVKRFEKTVDRHFSKFYEDSERSRKQEAGQLIPYKQLKGFLTIRFHKWNDAAIADLSAMWSYGLLGAYLQKIYPSDEARSKQNLLLQGIPDLVSSKPSQKLWELTQLIKNNSSLLALCTSLAKPEDILSQISSNSEYQLFHESFQLFIFEWGYRCSGELMLTKPNFLEQPQKVIELLQAYISNETRSPKAIITEKVAEKKLLIASIKKDLLKQNFGYLTGLFQIPLLSFLVYWTEKSIGYRERVRLKQALLYGHLRSTLLDLGSVLYKQGVIENANHIFFLKYNELLDLLSSAEMLPASIIQMVRARIDEHKEKSKMDVPDTFSLPEGEFASENMSPAPSFVKNSSNTYKGISACGGIVKGQAKVLSSVLESRKIQPGDILVVKQTDPGWAPIFPLISGLIVERGGMLSHGAIVAREFGIPAVVGIKHITTIIKDGTEVLVNGENGSIQF